MAIVLVMVFHGGIAVSSSGMFGVTIFFTLSGFLITSLLLEEHAHTGRVDLKRFYARRALRLLPALAVVLAVVEIDLVIEHLSLKEVLAIAFMVIFYVSDLAKAFDWSPIHLNQTWSLALEERFYIFWPITLLLLLRSRRRWLAPVACAAGLLICVATRVAVGTTPPASHAADVAFLAVHRADALFVGCLLALVLGLALRLPRRTITGLGVLGVALLLIGLAVCRPARTDDGWFTLVPWATAALLLWLLTERGVVARALEWTPLRYTGRISYGLYLWHYPIFILVQKAVDLPLVAEFMVQSAVACAAAVLSFVFIEQPFLRLKRRFAPSGRALLSAP